MSPTLPMRRLLFLSLILITALTLSLSAQDSQEESAVSAKRLLEDALLIIVDISVNNPAKNTELWNNTVEKITIPGRAVSLTLEGEGARLKVMLTPYPADDDTLFLVAKSETWEGEEYSSALSSIPIAYRDEVYYYPLGRAEESQDESMVEVRMSINIVPYLETLDEDDRTALESVIDSSAQFNLSGEDN
ncbi:MAG: hypothetical protein RQ801_00025 [Spirochaetaceae bacterium]|nr:hypothetical protein [Spirochaetaceae bacterium]MDT8296654.1 hypothetical protein [Spirochaetaceae bacterium]